MTRPAEGFGLGRVQGLRGTAADSVPEVTA